MTIINVLENGEETTKNTIQLLVDHSNSFQEESPLPLTLPFKIYDIQQNRINV